MKSLITTLFACAACLTASAASPLDSTAVLRFLETAGQGGAYTAGASSRSEAGEPSGIPAAATASSGSKDSFPSGNPAASGDSSSVGDASTSEEQTGIPSPVPATVPAVASTRNATAASQPVTFVHTHSVAYAGLDKQPVVRIKVTADAVGTVTKMTLNSAATSSVSDMTNLQLYYSGSTPYFSLHESGTAQARPVMSTLAKGAKLMSFTGSQAIAAGDNYFWLTCTVSARARGSNKIDAACESVEINGNTVECAPLAREEGCMKVFPYKYRIIPYFRNSFLMEWNKDLLTAEHFKKMTDIIHCYVNVTAEGEIRESEMTLKEGLAKLKTLRGKNNVNILLCFMHCADNMPTIVANETLRNTCAKNLADYIKANGYDGVDLDWEYPGTPTLWNQYVQFIGKLREELGGMGTISAAVSQWNINSRVFADQLDFINMMSYDDEGNHSTMAKLTGDVTYARDTLQMPACKVIGGLPFYSNEVVSRNWDAQEGYSYVVNNFPNIAPNVNTFIHKRTGKQHYFNGISLIKSKCQYIVGNNFGGVMIWCYDGDVPITHPKALSRAMYTIIRQMKR